MSEIGSKAKAVSISSASSAAGAAAAVDQVAGKAKTAKKGANAASTPFQPLSGSISDELLFNAIPELASPIIDQEILVNVLKKLSVDLSQHVLAGEIETLKFDQDKMQTLAKENIKKLKHMLKSLAKKKKAGLLGKIFSWVAAVVGTILGAVIATATFGAGSVAAGTLIAVSTALAVSLTIASATGGMEKLTAELAKGFASMFEAFGMDSKKAKRVAQIVAQVAIAIAVIAVQIVMLVLTGGASAEEFASEMVQKIASFTIKATSIAIGLVTMAGGGASAATGVYNYESLQDRAGITDTKSFLKTMQSLIDSESDLIQEIVHDIMHTQTNMAHMIKAENENRAILANIGGQPNAV